MKTKDVDIDDLRSRVLRLRKQREAQELRDELYGRHQDVDLDAVYMTTAEVAALADVFPRVVTHAIRIGELKAVKTRADTYRGISSRWAIHPDDGADWAEKVKRLNAVVRNQSHGR